MSEASNELSQLRANLQLTQNQMAQLMGIPFRTYQDIEAGKSALRPIHVRVAKFAAERAAEGIDSDDVRIIVHPFQVGDDGMLVDGPALAIWGQDIETAARRIFGDEISLAEVGPVDRVLGSIAAVRNGKVEKKMVYRKG